MSVGRENGVAVQCMARALYDNIAETPDELAFRRGDVLTVLEQNTAGCEGWWLCTLRGRQGICPGNRLRLIPGAYDTTISYSRPSRKTRSSSASVSPAPSPHFTKLEENVLYDVPGPPQPVCRQPTPTSCDWYDAPRAPRPASADSGTGSAGSYDIPRVNKSRALPLTCDAALDALDRLQDESQAAGARLLAHVRPSWRRPGMLSPHITDLRVAATRLKVALHDLVVFVDATLANASEAQDKGLAQKLRPAVKALRDAEKITTEATNALDSGDWSPLRLERDEDPTDGVQDALDQLVACARGLTEDVRRVASLIHGNAKLLFKSIARSEWTEDCDYVRLESRDSVDRKRDEIRTILPDKMKNTFDTLSRESDAGTRVSLETANIASQLEPDDRTLAAFYARQTATHSIHLANAVEAFLKTVELGEKPAAILEHGKFVVLSAHRLVLVGDAVHRSAKCSQLAADALRRSDALSEALTSVVASCRDAAVRWPCRSASGDAASAARHVAVCAKELRHMLLRVAAQDFID